MTFSGDGLHGYLRFFSGTIFREMRFDPNRVKAVLFDIDGTIADTDDEYIRRVAAMFGPLRALFPRRDPKPFLRWGVTTAISPINTLIGFPDVLGLDDDLVKFFNWLSDRFDQQSKGHFVLMEGVAPVLACLAQRYPLGVVSARPERGTHLFLAQFNLHSYFGAVAHAQTVVHTKPYPDPVEWCAAQLGVKPHECVMVGDTAVDMVCGQRAGAQTIGVLCGFGSLRELELARATLIVPHTTRLTNVLLGAGG